MKTTKKKNRLSLCVLHNRRFSTSGNIGPLRTVVAFITLCFLACANATSTTYVDTLSVDEKLALGDAVKVTDHPQFLSILGELNAMQDSLTDKQQMNLKYLQAFRMAYSNERQLAIELYEKVYQSTTDASLRQRALGSLIYNYGYIGDWEKGLGYVDELLPMLDGITEKDARIRAHEVVINFYIKIGEYSLALQQLDVLYGLNLSDNKKCIANMLEVEARLNLDQLSDRIDSAYQSIGLCETAGDSIAANYIRVYLAQHFLDRQRSEAAMALLSDDSIQTITYAPLLASYLATNAQTWQQMNNPEQARSYAMKVVGDVRFQNYIPPLITSYELLYQLAANEQSFDEAFQYLKQYEHLHTVNLQREKSRNLAVQQARNDAINKTNRINLLNKENRLLQTQADLARQEAHNHRLALALAFTLMVLLFFWAYRGRKLQLKFERLARNDSLTNIYNRGYFTHLATQELKDAEDRYRNTSMILFDLDEFKSINDTYGHQTGDWAIQQAVSAVKEHCRGNDVFGRVGGEEFAILLPGCSLEKATDIAEVFRQAVAAIETPSSLTPFNITASFGVSDSHSSGFSFEKLFAAADNALYQSKHRGRNRVFSTSPKHLAG